MLPNYIDMHKPNPSHEGMSENSLATLVIDQCFKIHRKWGPGLLESVYEALLEHHLSTLGYRVERQKAIPFVEDGVKLDLGFRADLIVEGILLVELKSIEYLTPVVPKTVLTYLKILDLKLGLVINFGEAYLRDGIKRVINGKLQ